MSSSGNTLKKLDLRLTHLESDNEAMGDCPVDCFLLDLIHRLAQDGLQLSQRGYWASQMRTIVSHLFLVEFAQKRAEKERSPFGLMKKMMKDES